MFLCKDFNLHTLFGAEDYAQLNEATEVSGLLMGSFKICGVYREQPVIACREFVSCLVLRDAFLDCHPF